MKFKRTIYQVFLMSILCLSQINAKNFSACEYPEASNRQLTPEDLKEKSLWELKIMRNEIFARHGYKFKSEEMKSYFDKQKWYEPKYNNVNSKLTYTESSNIKLIKEYEDNLKKTEKASSISELIEKQKREIVFKTPWGSETTELNHIIPEEANPEAPMSFVVDESGTIFVLDQVNKRIQVFENNGKHVKAIPLSSYAYSDIDMGISGNLFVLDTWKDKAVLLIDQEGNLLQKSELVGERISEVGGVWQIYSRSDGLWVVYENSMVRICDQIGETDNERPATKGILCRDGKHIIDAEKIGDITVAMARSLLGKSGIDNFTVYFDIPVLFVTFVDMDSNGDMYLGVQLLDESGEQGPPYSLEEAHEIVVILDKNGKEKNRIYMPVSTEAEEVRRSHRVTPDGIIYQLVIEEEGATMWKYSP